jgi:hypothetical protein
MRCPLPALILTTLVAVPASAAAPTAVELLRHVPAAAAVVVAMDAAALRAHPVVQAWLAEHQEAWSGTGTETQEFLREAGLDPLHDVDRLVAAMVPQPGGRRAMVVVAGRFDAVSLGAALTTRGATPFDLGGVTAFRLQHGGSSAGEAPVMVISHDLILAGDETCVRASLAQDRPPSPLVASEIAAGRIDPAATFWLVASIPQQVRQVSAAAPEMSGDGTAELFHGMLTASRTILRVSIQASLGSELSLVGSALADNEEDAGLLRDAIKGAIAAARLQAQGQTPELLDVLRSITVSADGSEVHGSVTVPVALIEKLVEQHRQHCEAASQQLR